MDRICRLQHSYIHKGVGTGAAAEDDATDLAGIQPAAAASCTTATAPAPARPTAPSAACSARPRRPRATATV